MTDSGLTLTDHDAAERAQAVRLGRALKVLRERAGLSQSEAGEGIGVSGEGWAKYERGAAAGIFRPAMQARLTLALGQTVEALNEEVARIAALSPVPGRGEGAQA